jgi:hypothetical protein
MRTTLPQNAHRRAAFGKKILGMDFNKVKRRRRFKQLAVVRMPPANADRRGMGGGCSH